MHHMGGDDRSSTRVRIVDAALRCLARQGPAKTTVDDIAREAGFSRATLYRTFPGGKEDVLAAVVVDRGGPPVLLVGRGHGRGQDLEDVLVAGMVEAARRLSTHRALGYLLSHEPGVILPHLAFADMDRILFMAGDFAAPFFARWLDPGSGLAGGRMGRPHRAGLCGRPGPGHRPDRPRRHPGPGAHLRPARGSWPCGSPPRVPVHHRLPIRPHHPPKSPIHRSTTSTTSKGAVQ